MKQKDTRNRFPPFIRVTETCVVEELVRDGKKVRQRRCVSQTTYVPDAPRLPKK